MGCNSSKPSAPTRPVANPAGTLLTASDGGVKSPKAAELDTATPQATQPNAQSPEETQLDTSMPESASDAVLPESAQSVSATPKNDEHLQSPTEETNLESAADKSLAVDHEQKTHNDEVHNSLVTAEDTACVEADRSSPVSKQNYLTDERVESAQTPTSRVIKNPQGWQEEGILFPHEGVRFLMQEMCDAIDSMDPQPAWKWENLTAWYQDYFYAVVHHHHDAEEQIYLPWIQTRVSVPEKISADHPELMKAMDDLRDMFQAGGTLPVGDRAAHLSHVRQRVHAFVEDMQQHLAEEEELIPQLLREGAFTQEEEGPIVGKIIEGLGLGRNKAALPPMLHAYARWAGEEKADAFVSANLPPPIQFLYRYFWLNDFQTRHLGLIASLAEGVDTNPYASRWFC